MKTTRCCPGAEFLGLIVLGITLSALPGAFLFAQNGAKDKETEMRQLLEKMGMREVIGRFRSELLTEATNSYPEAQGELLNEVVALFDGEQLMQRLLPICEPHVSLEDIRALNGFFETPPGKALRATLVRLGTEGWEAGQQWREARFVALADLMEERGVAKVAYVKEREGPFRLSTNELSQIQGEASATWRSDARGVRSYFNCDIYNGTSHALAEVTVLLMLDAVGGQHASVQRYKLQPQDGMPLAPQAKGVFSAEIGTVLRERGWRWSLIGATGMAESRTSAP